MSWIHGVAHRIRTVFSARAYERDLQDEMRLHEELDAVQQRDPSRARRRFGNRTYYLEEARRMTWLGTLDVVQQDARFAWRSLKHNPGLTALIVVTFTLGIGVNAATFTLLDKLYLRQPAGVADPSTVRRIWFHNFRMEGGPTFGVAMSYPMFRALRETWGDSNRIALVNRVSDYRIGGTRRGPKVDALFATASYWPVLGLRPQIGRFYSVDEDRLGSGAPVTVLSDHLWRSEFGADSGIVGKSIKLDDGRYTVIGVAPPGFTGIDLEPADLWMPLAAWPKPGWMKEPFWESSRMIVFNAFARATPGADLTAFDVRATRAIQAHERIDPSLHDTLMTVTTGSIIYTRGPGKQEQEHLLSTRLSAVAIVVLLIAAANIVNLLLARATRRRREIAVRLALGVGRWRLVRMLTAETLLLALIAAVAAVLAARWGGNALRSLLLPDIRFVEPAIGMRVVVFTFVIALVAGLVAGIVPALQASNPDLTRSLKEGARDGVVQRSRLRSALVVTQAALSVVLLAGAALFVRSLQNVRGLDIGFDATQVVIATVNFDPGQDPSAPALTEKVEELARRLEPRPGVQSVARSSLAPMWGFSFAPFWFGNDSSRSLKDKPPVLNVVDQRYFATTGLRILRGNVFADGRGAPPQVVVNEAMARQLWPGRDPIGQCLRYDGRAATCYSVVGVVETARRDKVIEEPTPQYYLPMSNLPTSLARHGSGTVLLVRAMPALESRVIAELTEELKVAFPGGYPDIRRLSEQLEPQYRPWRVGAVLFTGFGVLALLVAVVGIYSTVSYGVTQRTHEFGVRIALGARIADVLRLVLGEGLRTVALGVVVGIALAVASSRLIAALLYGIGANDPSVMVTVSAVLLFVAAAATLIPAWRAARVDPITALRAD